MVHYSRERVAFGQALSEDSLVRHHVAQSRMDITQVTTAITNTKNNSIS